MDFRKYTRLLASPRWLFWLLPWFMVLLILGTVAQRYIGLVEAQKLFFSSWILWLWLIPTPGGIATLALITLSLTAKLALYSPWSRDKAGIILSHLGIWVLMLGGAMAYLLQQEGYVTLMEGESTTQMQDYYTRELTLYADGKAIQTWEEEKLKKKPLLKIESLPFSLHITQFCDNCQSYVQENKKGKRGLARMVMLDSAPLRKEKEENKAGITFTLKGAGEKEDGEYIAYELLPSQAPKWKIKNTTYQLVMARQNHPLPFSIKLLDFAKITYPNSDQASEYQSLVEITDGNRKWEQTIAMNEPLRYQGYALYQSSFIEVGDAQASVLSIVKNDSWLAPYFGTFVLALGLVWQSILHSKKRRQQ
jgi:hypothetical protein